MIKQNIKFLTTGQFLTFSHTCKNLSSDLFNWCVEISHRVSPFQNKINKMLAHRYNRPEGFIVLEGTNAGGQKGY